MKYCSNCGAQINDNSAFCSSCGASVNGNNANATTNNGNNFNGNNFYVNNFNNNNCPVVSRKEIVTCILLSIFTCGIYGIIWFANMTDDSNKVSNSNDPSGGMTVFLILITCGIYGIYWYYRMGQKLSIAGQTYNKDIKDNSLIYLLLGVFGLGIVAECLIQNDLNKFAN